MLASDSGPPLRPEGLAKHHFRLRPASPTEDAPNLYLLLFSNWHCRSQLRPTDWGCPLNEDLGNGRSK